MGHQKCQSVFFGYFPSFAGATTRKAASAELLKANGADEVFIDSGSIAADVEKAGKFDKAKLSITLRCSNSIV